MAELTGLPPEHADRTRFDAVFAASRTQVVRTAFLIVGSHAVAEEISQEAFLRLYEHFDDVTNPGGFLRTTAVRLCLSWRRREVLEAARVATASEPGPTGAFEIDETWDALGALKPDLRAALVLRYYEDLSHAEIAEVDGMPGRDRAFARASRAHRPAEGVGAMSPTEYGSRTTADRDAAGQGRADPRGDGVLRPRRRGPQPAGPRGPARSRVGADRRGGGADRRGRRSVWCSRSAIGTRASPRARRPRSRSPRSRSMPSRSSSTRCRSSRTGSRTERDRLHELRRHPRPGLRRPGARGLRAGRVGIRGAGSRHASRSRPAGTTRSTARSPGIGPRGWKR